MYHFFVTPDQVDGETICVRGSDVNHICNVLRMKTGEEVQISDGNNQKYRCRISRFEKEQVILTIEETIRESTELPSRIYLFQGLPKSDKMDLIVQKAVELGVYEIIPVQNKRSVVRLDAKKAQKKTERWNTISVSAAKQSGRSIVPVVKEPMDFQKALDYAATLDVILLPYELSEGMDRTKEVIGSIAPGQSVGIFIGPEGGFETAEVSAATEQNAKVITLGKRILRTETAGLAILSILMYHLESDVHIVNNKRNQGEYHGSIFG